MKKTIIGFNKVRVRIKKHLTNNSIFKTLLRMKKNISSKNQIFDQDSHVIVITYVGLFQVKIK